MRPAFHGLQWVAAPDWAVGPDGARPFAAEEAEALIAAEAEPASVRRESGSAAAQGEMRAKQESDGAAEAARASAEDQPLEAPRPLRAGLCPLDAKDPATPSAISLRTSGYWPEQET